MTDPAHPPAEQPNVDIHHALALAVLAAKGARTAVEVRSTPAQRAQMKELIAGGAQPTLAVRIDGDGQAHIEFHLLPPEDTKFFEHPMLKFDGPAIAALAPPEAVTTFDRGKLN